MSPRSSFTARLYQESDESGEDDDCDDGGDGAGGDQTPLPVEAPLRLAATGDVRAFCSIARRLAQWTLARFGPTNMR